ncbi:hypothetical protein AB6A40_009686 [Gnathostoma spinigerum]|uniref:Uncharacterized protein n=1 Tax=Gnathostoma spinigerum TaxID=75299 RepID=A0ABD6EV47_9BILA
MQVVLICILWSINLSFKGWFQSSQVEILQALDREVERRDSVVVVAMGIRTVLDAKGMDDMVDDDMEDDDMEDASMEDPRDVSVSSLGSIFQVLIPLALKYFETSME